MLEDPKIFLESLQSAVEGFSKVDRETLKAFENLNETALKPVALDRKGNLQVRVCGEGAGQPMPLPGTLIQKACAFCPGYPRC